MNGGGRVLRCAALLQRAGWLAPAYVTLDGTGCVVDVGATAPVVSAAGSAAGAELPVDNIPGYVIPGFQNAHSHAFQYAMTGLAEHRSAAAALDDFWSWRTAMYHLAQRLTPDHLEAVAAMVYAEMLRFGVTAVTEFHYLHHGAGGRPYANQAEMGCRLMAAAATAGIHLTLVPVCYRQGGFGQAAKPDQERFLSRSVDDYRDLLDRTRAAAQGRADVLVGRGVHSLRAVAEGEVKVLLGAPAPGPTHLHVAEQNREVQECLSHLGKRPVAWLLANLPLDASYCLVHATHVNGAELAGLAACRATVVLCPSTEGNLGDGFFPLRDFLGMGGGFALGSDSQVTLNPLEELRWLDYGQRLRAEVRNVLCAQAGDDSGRIAVDLAWTHGRAAMGLPAADYFSPGQPFDAVVLDPEHPVLAGRPADRRLAALVYAGDASCFAGTIRRGQWLVEGQRHYRLGTIKAAFIRALAKLSA